MPFNDCYDSIKIIQRQCLNISRTYSFIENDKAAEEPHTKILVQYSSYCFKFSS